MKASNEEDLTAKTEEANKPLRESFHMENLHASSSSNFPSSSTHHSSELSKLHQYRRFLSVTYNLTTNFHHGRSVGNGMEMPLTAKTWLWQRPEFFCLEVLIDIHRLRAEDEFRVHFQQKKPRDSLMG